VNWSAIGIYVLTVLVELPFMNSSIFEGPVAKAMGGGDIAWILGFFVAAILYYVSTRMKGERSQGEAVTVSSPGTPDSRKGLA